MKRRLLELHGRCDVFNVGLSTDRLVEQMGIVIGDLQSLKATWDLVDLVSSHIAAWGASKWESVNVDAMEERCMELAGAMGELDAAVVHTVSEAPRFSSSVSRSS